MRHHSHVRNLEWGRKPAKAEDAMRGLNNQDRRAACAEGLADATEADAEPVAVVTT